MTRQTTRRGRPPLRWLAHAELPHLTPGTAVSLELVGRHTARTVGRIITATPSHLLLDTPRGETLVRLDEVRRGRTVPALYEPGDPVLRRHVPAASWRGGVVRTSGTDVLVEQIDGTFAWFAEGDLEPADARAVAPPPLKPGPAPAVTL